MEIHYCGKTTRLDDTKKRRAMGKVCSCRRLFVIVEPNGLLIQMISHKDRRPSSSRDYEKCGKNEWRIGSKIPCVVDILWFPISLSLVYSLQFCFVLFELAQMNILNGAELCSPTIAKINLLDVRINKFVRS